MSSQSLCLARQTTTAVFDDYSILSAAGKGNRGRDAMTNDARSGEERACRFQDAALTYIDDVYTFARFLKRDPAEAENAVQECYRRAFLQFDNVSDQSIKTWLLAILRNACYPKFIPCKRRGTPTGRAACKQLLTEPSRQSEATYPAIPGRFDKAIIQRIVAALPMQLREAIVLREFIGLSYREIAEVVSLPIGTVVSRLARARATLLVAWKATDASTRCRPKNPTRGGGDAEVAAAADVQRLRESLLYRD
jgi:RNA polymerase sigma-70 factor, ECF subfamily